MSVGPVDPAYVVQRVINNYKHALEGRRLNVHFDPETWPHKIRGDSELLTLAVSSLISNAIKYTPDQGHIYITAQADEQQLRLCIRDTGIGVAKEEQERIFERFHTAGDTMLHSTSKTAFRGGGLGLGLAVCKGIIDAHGGRVWVESSGLNLEKLPGSEFIVLLPLVAHVQRRTTV
jgi:signal transduction histidine kinase